MVDYELMQSKLPPTKKTDKKISNSLPMQPNSMPTFANFLSVAYEDAAQHDEFQFDEETKE